MTQPSDTQPEVSGGAVRITAAPPEQVRVVLFYIDDVAYTVPKRIPANLGLRFLEVAAYRGSGVAQVFLMDEMVGDDAMADLKACDGMTDEQFQALRDRFDEMFFGQVDELLNGPKGTKKGSRNSRGS